MTQVPFDHSGHEEIAVVVALMNSERERLAAALGFCFEVVRPQLLFKKRISGADIHEQAEHQGTKPCWCRDIVTVASPFSVSTCSC